MFIFRRALPGLPMFAAGSLLLQVWGASEAVAAERRFLIDFGAGTASTPGWNNIHFGHTGSELSGLVDSTGVTSGLSLQITDGFWQGWTGAYNGEGTTASSLYPATATQDSFFIGTNQGLTDELARLRISGLAINGTYSLRFYASRMTADQTSDRTALYTVGTQTVELQARNNIDGYAQLSGLAPSNGALDITLTMKPGAVFGYLGVLELIEQDSVVELTPRTLTPRMTTVPKIYNGPMGYYESLPRGYDADPNRQWPLLIFLHGNGERGNGTTELPKVLETGLPEKINAGHQLEFTVNGVSDSFVVLIPQTGTGSSGWHPYQVERLLDIGLASYRIDPKRVYVTGLSLGGFGTTAFVEFSLANAQRIAAIAPSDGAHYGHDVWTPDLGSVLTNTCYIAQAGVKVWLFYGETDGGWGWTASQFVDRLNACSPAPVPAPVVTVYPGVGHAAWYRAYMTDHTWHTPNLYEWLLAQRRP
ncbi:hypothetical protein ACN28E_24295 [Archangium lansingense]|uniref:carboxylesterase family protein n=1 Tax=Archangium lansingense TaxID=2995310 RepID=UPI003B7D9B77